MLKIYNTLSGEKQVFKPLHENQIGIYVCGNTVYDYCHIGHARSMIMFDVVVRYLRFRYPNDQVTYVRNITDIDDKIIKRALENNEPIDALTQRFIDAQHEDERALGIAAPDYEPRATQYLPHMLKMIQQLLDNGHAYIAEDGDVYFKVRSFAEYGKLSRRNIEQLRTGVRMESADTKRDPLDFVLWKISKPGEPHWPSPWGEGRPGWHIECAAMSTDLLGQPFDIHGGGMDLKFPHHENEITEAEAACGKDFAKLWMHVGLLQVDGAKMSKSLGNFLTIRDALNQHHPEELRFFMLNSSYDQPADYTQRTVDEAIIRLSRFYLSLDGLEDVQFTGDFPEKKRFIEIMDDDFNTPLALAYIGELCGEINILKSKQQLDQAKLLASKVRQLAKILGILQDFNYLTGSRSSDEWQQAQQLASERDIARAQKNWSRADEIRKELIAKGWEVEDTSTGTRIRKFR